MEFERSFNHREAWMPAQEAATENMAAPALPPERDTRAKMEAAAAATAETRRVMREQDLTKADSLRTKLEKTLEDTSRYDAPVLVSQSESDQPTLSAETKQRLEKVQAELAARASDSAEKSNQTAPEFVGEIDESDAAEITEEEETPAVYRRKAA